MRKLLRQAKPRTRLGAIQMQLSATMGYYVVYINIGLMGTMWWHTTGAPFLRQYYSGASFWMFLIVMMLVLFMAMAFDYKFAYPSRVAFINKQAYKHDNPSVRDLKEILAQNKEIKDELKIIKERLGITDD